MRMASGWEVVEPGVILNICTFILIFIKYKAKEPSLICITVF